MGGTWLWREAIVSEGFAGHFVQEIFHSAPEPWKSLNPESVQRYIPQLCDEWYRTDYNAWFYGTGDFPLWSGSLGFTLVARYLKSTPHLRGKFFGVLGLGNMRRCMLSDGLWQIITRC